MTDDLVKRLRDLAECAVDVAPYEAMMQAADRIELLERELEEERRSREAAAAKAWEFAERIEALEMALRHCVDAIREYELGDRRPERTPRPDIRPWLLGAMDNARVVLEGKND